MCSCPERAVSWGGRRWGQIAGKLLTDSFMLFAVLAHVIMKSKQTFIQGYKLMKHILAQGSHSIAYIDTDNPDIVVKENNNISKDPGYLKRQLAGYGIIKQILDSGYETGVVLPHLVSVSESDNKQIIKEYRIKGKTFDIDGLLYNKLSEKEKNVIAKQMALFLVAMHSAGEMSPAEKSIKTMFDRSTLHNSNDIAGVYNGSMPETLRKRIQSAEQYLNSSDISDEVHVLTHRDLRSSNLMYDSDAMQLAVLDFELADKDNVYRDFVAYSSSSSMPWDFTARVIHEYNAISNKKYPIQINPEKVQNMLVYAIAQEFARCVKSNDEQEISDTEKKKYFDLLYNKIKSVAGIDIRASAFKSATKDVKNKLSNRISNRHNAADFQQKHRPNGR